MRGAIRKFLAAKFCSTKSGGSAEKIKIKKQADGSAANGLFWLDLAAKFPCARSVEGDRFLRTGLLCFCYRFPAGRYQFPSSSLATGTLAYSSGGSAGRVCMYSCMASATFLL